MQLALIFLLHVWFLSGGATVEAQMFRKKGKKTGNMKEKWSEKIKTGMKEKKGQGKGDKKDVSKTKDKDTNGKGKGKSDSKCPLALQLEGPVAPETAAETAPRGLQRSREKKQHTKKNNVFERVFGTSDKALLKTKWETEFQSQISAKTTFDSLHEETRMAVLHDLEQVSKFEEFQAQCAAISIDVTKANPQNAKSITKESYEALSEDEKASIKTARENVHKCRKELKANALVDKMKEKAAKVKEAGNTLPADFDETYAKENCCKNWEILAEYKDLFVNEEDGSNKTETVSVDITKEDWMQQKEAKKAEEYTKLFEKYATQVPQNGYEGLEDKQKWVELTAIARENIKGKIEADAKFIELTGEKEAKYNELNSREQWKLVSQFALKAITAVVKEKVLPENWDTLLQTEKTTWVKENLPAWAEDFYLVHRLMGGPMERGKNKSDKGKIGKNSSKKNTKKKIFNKANKIISKGRNSKNKKQRKIRQRFTVGMKNLPEAESTNEEPIDPLIKNGIERAIATSLNVERDVVEVTEVRVASVEESTTLLRSLESDSTVTISVEYEVSEGDDSFIDDRIQAMMAAASDDGNSFAETINQEVENEYKENDREDAAPAAEGQVSFAEPQQILFDNDIPVSGSLTSSLSVVVLATTLWGIIM